MKFVALVSGGKDSIFAIQQAVLVGHELVACLHMARPLGVLEESYMYQSAASELVRIQVEECLQVPYIQYTRIGTSQQTGLVYLQQHQEQSNDPPLPEPQELEDSGQLQVHEQHDEVEDLYHALKLALDQYPEIEAVCCGAILSTYQRVRVEHVVCQRLRLNSLAYLWRSASQLELLGKMLASGIEAVLVRTAAPPGLLPHKHLNRPLTQFLDYFNALNLKYQFHICGEGGEYETLCVDSPLFHKRLVLDEVQIELDDPRDETVGNLRILACHSEHKPNHIPQLTSSLLAVSPQKSSSVLQGTASTVSKTIGSPEFVLSSQILCLPRVKRVRGGLWHVSEISSPAPPTAADNKDCDESALAIQEALGIFEILAQVLKQHDCTPQDVVMVHFYLSDISLFARINQYYSEFFGCLLPPSRSCIAPPFSLSPQRHRVLLDCLVQCQSGRAMRNNLQPLRRQVLHVQSRSHWAPVCVGPYSQANTLWNALYYFAGQIGLDPPTMTLVQSDDAYGCAGGNWKRQLQQTWTNVANVLDALDNSCLEHNLLSCLIYVKHSLILEDKNHVISDICGLSQKSIRNNGGVIPGLIDFGKSVAGFDDRENLYDGYEDEETRREMVALQKQKQKNHQLEFLSPCLLVVEISHLPIGADVEVEVVAATKKASKYLQRTIHPVVMLSTAQVPRETTTTATSSKSDAGTHGSDNGHIWKWDTGQDDLYYDDDSDNTRTIHNENTRTKQLHYSTHDNNFLNEQQQFVFCSSLCTLGKGCAGYAVVTASIPSSSLVSPSSSMMTTAQKNGAAAAADNLVLILPDGIEPILESMVRVLDQSLSKTNGDLRLDQILHIRLYHLLSLSTCTELKSAMFASLRGIRPAVTVIPVYSIHLAQPLDIANQTSFSIGADAMIRSQISNDDYNSNYFSKELEDAIMTRSILAMQVTFIEPTNLETELWIRSDRD